MQSRTCVAALALLAPLLNAGVARADVFETSRIGGVVGAGFSTQARSFVAGALVQYPLPQGVALGLELDFVGLSKAYEPEAVRPRLLRLLPELSYHWEVLRLVPRVGLAAGYQIDLTRSSVGGGVVAPQLGFDYLFSRSLRAGIEYRPVWCSNLRVTSSQLLQHELLVRFELGSGW